MASDCIRYAQLNKMLDNLIQQAEYMADKSDKENNKWAIKLKHLKAAKKEVFKAEYGTD